MTMAADKQDKVLNVPTLRFPEFKDDWNDYHLRDLCTFHSGGTPSIDNVEYWEGEIPFVSAVAMHNTHIEKTPLTLTEKGLRDGSKQLEAGNLLLLVRGSMLWNKIPICYNDVDVAFNQDVKGIVPNSKTTSLFLLNWIQSHENRIKYMVTGTGIGAGKLDSEDLLALNVKLPSLIEQKKIEKFLSLIDERIETQIRIIEKLQSLMKGLAEHLTEFTPNTKIADCLNCHSSVLQENQVKSEGKYKVYGANGICGYSDKPAILEDAILIVKDGSGVGNVSYASGEYSVIGTSNYLTAKSGYSLKYLYYSLMVFNFIPYKTGMAIPHIYFKDYRKALIYCPSLDKQVQIASLLSKIECKIEADKAIADFYQQQKRFLLQSMFI